MLDEPVNANWNRSKKHTNAVKNSTYKYMEQINLSYLIKLNSNDDILSPKKRSPLFFGYPTNDFLDLTKLTKLYFHLNVICLPRNEHT